jgi:hypothetical protein
MLRIFGGDNIVRDNQQSHAPRHQPGRNGLN